MRKVNAWMGIGISNQYIQILKSLENKINTKDISSLKLILADEINNKYNDREKGQLSKDLFNLANKLKIEKIKVNVKQWTYFSKNKKYLNYLKKYKILFKEDNSFKKEVLNLVKKNRKIIEKKNLEKSANYVLEELASINFMSEKKIVKIGPKEKEADFDNLAKKYPITKVVRTKLF
jgi:hypothetical protein